MSGHAFLGTRSVRSSRLGREACRAALRSARRWSRAQGLARVVREIAAHPRRMRFTFDPVRLAALQPSDELVPVGSETSLAGSATPRGSGRTPRGPQGTRGLGEQGARRTEGPRGAPPRGLARAAAELARVHDGELARLCRRAVTLRLEGPSSAAGSSRGADGLRSAIEEELEWAARLVPRRGRRALLSIPAGCLERDPANWPSPTALAAASLLLAPHEAGRLCLGAALLAAGAREDAARVFELALARRPSAQRAAEMRRGLRAARGLAAEAPA